LRVLVREADFRVDSRLAYRDIILVLDLVSRDERIKIVDQESGFKDSFLNNARETA
jgi:hypothetical protein